MLSQCVVIIYITLSVPSVHRDKTGVKAKILS